MGQLPPQSRIWNGVPGCAEGKVFGVWGLMPNTINLPKIWQLSINTKKKFCNKSNRTPLPPLPLSPMSNKFLTLVIWCIFLRYIFTVIYRKIRYLMLQQSIILDFGILKNDSKTFFINDVFVLMSIFWVISNYSFHVETIFIYILHHHKTISTWYS